MIYNGTRLACIDNSGARIVQCIKVLKKSPTNRARIGSKIIVVVKRRNPRKKIKKGQILTALVVRDSKFIRRPEGSYIRFTSGACIILKGEQPLAKRILGPICKELRILGHIKVISLATIAL